MSAGRALKSMKEIFEVGFDLLLGRYPPFVYGRQLLPGEIPVFVFHGVQREPFEEMLRYLERNGYSTLTSEDLLRLHRARKDELPPRPVMLTFDDGLKSVHDIAYPLLKSHGFKATTFLIPGRIGEDARAGTSPGRSDGSGNLVAGPPASPPRTGAELASWAEISAMHESGVIDFQSHTNHHDLVFASPGIVDFLRPHLLERYHPFEFPRECFEHRTEAGGLPFGRPLFATAPRMSDRARYIEDPELVRVCVEHAARRGSSFFEGRDWRGELNRLVRRYRKERAEAGRYEGEDERRAAILEDLQSSRDIIEGHLPGKAVRSLCFPWGVGGTAAMEAARSIGFEALYWGKVGGKLLYRRFDDPFRISRIGEDFFPLLPGRGRRSVRHLVTKKIGKRMRRGSPYLSH